MEIAHKVIPNWLDCQPQHSYMTDPYCKWSTSVSWGVGSSAMPDTVSCHHEYLRGQSHSRCVLDVTELKHELYRSCSWRVHGSIPEPTEKLASDNATLKLLDGILRYTLTQTEAHHARFGRTSNSSDQTELQPLMKRRTPHWHAPLDRDELVQKCWRSGVTLCTSET